MLPILVHLQYVVIIISIISGKIKWLVDVVAYNYTEEFNGWTQMNVDGHFAMLKFTMTQKLLLSHVEIFIITKY